MRILITGGTGFIGSHVARTLRARGHKCVLLDLVAPSSPDPDFIHGDIRNPEAVSSAIGGCEAVLHLAAAHHDYGISDATFSSVNVIGTRIVAAAAAAAGIGRICFTSTAAVYGGVQELRNEFARPTPTTAYGRTKLEAEQLLSAWAAAHPERDLLVIRPTAVFGPGNFANMYTLIRQIDRGRFAMVGRMDNYKSLAYVENLAEALSERWPIPTRPGIRLVNYADTPDLTSHEIAEAVYRGLGKLPPRWSIPMRLARLTALPFDIVTALSGKDFGISGARLQKFAAAETRLGPGALAAEGYQPIHSLTDGIQRMVSWYLSVRHMKDVAPRLPPAIPV